MHEPSLAQRERAELCDLLEELGPDAPTLDEGWTTADLAAHLVVRERDPRTGPGIVLRRGRAAALTARLQAAEKAKGYDAVVARVRSGPPWWWKLPGVDGTAGLNEFFLHHEDVRRANGRGRRPRAASTTTADQSAPGPPPPRSPWPSRRPAGGR